MCVCVCVWNIWTDVKLLRFKHAGGAGGTDETGTNKDTHQMPVISMGTLIDVPASLFCDRAKGLSQEPQGAMLYGWRNLIASVPFQNSAMD